MSLGHLSSDAGNEEREAAATALIILERVKTFLAGLTLP